MQLDYISKMSKGKRIPKEEERLTCLLDAMECTGNTRADLLFLYRQEKMGKSQWQCMEELIRIIQQDVVEFPQVSVSPSVSGIPDTDMTLDNIFAIYACIRKAMIMLPIPRFAYVLRKFHWNIYDILFRLFMKCPIAD